MKLSRLAIVVAAGFTLAACGGSNSSSTEDILNLENVGKVLETNADIAYAAYSDSVTTAQALKAALADFRANPSEANLQAAKRAWLVAREPYGQTEVYRFRNSPIDSTDYSSEDGPEGAINAWPLGEALIDDVIVLDSEMNISADFGTSEIGVTDNEVSGTNGRVGDENVTDDGTLYEITAEDYDDSDNIISRTDIEINTALLELSATAEDEHDVISGYHAIEFLLWGQDLNDNGETTDGTDRGDAVKVLDEEDADEDNSFYAAGGDRPIEEFQPSYDAEAASGNENVDAAYDFTVESHRRHKFLEVAVDKLIADLESVRDGWAPGATYRTAFTTVTNEAQAKQKLTEILTGMGTLSEGELAGERMQIAFSANSQEDEHSCFSDNTHRDIWLNAEGISNSYYGDYAGYDSTLDGLVGSGDETGRAYEGYGIDDYLNDAGLSDIKAEVEATLTETASRYQAIDAKARNGEPFDVLIMDSSNSEVQNTILALYSESEALEDLADALAITSDITQDDATGCDVSSLSCE